MYLEIDFNSDEAFYVQLYHQIIIGIATSRLQEGDTLPSVRQLEGYIRLDRRYGAVIAVDADKLKAMEDMKQGLLVLLAKGSCKNITREEVHQLIDEIYEEYGA